MDVNQQQIIDKLSEEITKALISCEHSRYDPGSDLNKIDSYMKSYKTRVGILKVIRNKLEIEFTTMHYDPR